MTSSRETHEPSRADDVAPLFGMTSPSPRSYLFVPGNRPERFDKAIASGADAVILDLEDAVPPDAKNEARRAISAWLNADRPVVLRINAVETPWFVDDLALSRVAGIAAVMLAKTERASDVAALAGLAPVIPLIESAAGFGALQSIAAAPGVQRLAFGSIDLQLDLDMHAEFDDLLFFRSQLILASRLAGIDRPIDSPSTNVHAAAEVEIEARRACRLGFGAKLCIHPRQVAAANSGFCPSAPELDWARRVIEASEASRGAAVALDGKMIDKPVILRAKRILSQAR